MKESPLIYIAGVEWDDVAGTDRMLATALSRITPVLWVDPPVSATRYARMVRRGVPRNIGMSRVAPGIDRLRVLTTPGTSRFLLRDLAALHVARKVTQATHSSATTSPVVVASPEPRFPRRLRGKRMFFATDDWMGGAEMMGVKPSRVARRISRNARAADVTAAVTADLANKIREISSNDSVCLLPNGCTPASSAPINAAPRPTDLPPGPLVGLVGQINERLDLALITAVADAGATTVIIGPRTERAQATSRALDALFDHPNVHWLGRKDSAALPPYLASLSVGITPYIDSQFNRASFPLKTLEYLAAGLPVVSTDLPAVRWLGTEHIQVATTPSSFARITKEIASSPADLMLAAARVEFARQHSWDERAQQLLLLLENATSRSKSAKASTTVLNLITRIPFPLRAR